MDRLLLIHDLYSFGSGPKAEENLSKSHRSDQDLEKKATQEYIDRAGIWDEEKTVLFDSILLDDQRGSEGGNEQKIFSSFTSRHYRLPQGNHSKK